MTKRIIQFGTSRFLQAHADLFIHEARCAGQDIGPITIVKTTNGDARSQRISAFGNSEGFPVRIRGTLNHSVIENTVIVKSVDQAFSASENWEEIKTVFVKDAELVISNVGESGYSVSVTDQMGRPSENVIPESFPAKLLSLLSARFEFNAKPLLILPCELVSQNGAVLRAILNDIAQKWQLGPTFCAWMSNSVAICDTLVDRIVSEAIEPIGAIAEPYALWAIKPDLGWDIPFIHPSIIVTDNLEPYLRLKIHILNLGHSFLAQVWMSENRSPTETVREILADGIIKQKLLKLYQTEVVPGFTYYNMGHAAETYVVTTIERFENLFLNHRLSDIAQNHQLKIERRVVDFINWVKLRNPNQKFALLESMIDYSKSMTHN